MQLPAYWIPRPSARLDRRTRTCFDRLLDTALDHGPDRPLDYRLAAPKWQFLCHVADRADVVLHGTGDPGIRRFEPRRPADPLDFSSRHAVFAATDGIWPMFYAVLDRDRQPGTRTCNACVRVGDATGRLGEPHYFFSVTRTALARRPWRTGTVYLLPATGFERQPPIPTADGTVRVAQAASGTPVEPVARLQVQPADFPILHRVHGHDDAVLAARAAADPEGFPWFEG
ncbi:hypothetical protein [Streptomyces swartbergensis]|uniref:Uncharacterized protein n=1 Tax=Streptomyces swartbergensis TaxID=487165 RepID=A0A243S2H1_9ACTN|nr:hypothetical protein [Streptomyces swartbergensis]OUD01494.1 hypothetical protein CA983_19840 [Streptomyces swartbergensis]